MMDRALNSSHSVAHDAGLLSLYAACMRALSTVWIALAGVILIPLNCYDYTFTYVLLQ